MNLVLALSGTRDHTKISLDLHIGIDGSKFVYCDRFDRFSVGGEYMEVSS